jgi:lactoylglutathione lyase
MKLAHVALWTRDLDSSAAFWETYFGATVGAPYSSQRRPGFVSRFVHLPGGSASIELMTAPWLDAPVEDEHVGWDHIAVSVGDAAGVDRLAARCAADGRLLAAPRQTGDGHYEAVVAMPDGTRIEVTS